MKALIVANWKMNPETLKEAKKLLEVTKAAVQAARGVSVVVAPPSIFLRELAASSRKGRISFAVQNAHWDRHGAYTGETSLPQARDAKATYVIIGHAERRAMGETNEETRKKLSAALANQMTPIFCVGETKRSAGGEHFLFVREQLNAGFSDVPAAKLTKVIIAYEPVWAIGAQSAMRPRDMHEMSIFIRKTIVERFGDVGHNIKILYGGSVDASNDAAMLKDGGIKGLLVGRASADAEKFSELVKAIAQA